MDAGNSSLDEISWASTNQQETDIPETEQSGEQMASQSLVITVVKPAMSTEMEEPGDEDMNEPPQPGIVIDASSLNPGFQEASEVPLPAQEPTLLSTMITETEATSQEPSLLSTMITEAQTSEVHQEYVLKTSIDVVPDPNIDITDEPEMASEMKKALPVFSREDLPGGSDQTQETPCPTALFFSPYQPQYQDENSESGDVCQVSSDSETDTKDMTFRVNEDGALVPVIERSCGSPVTIISSSESDHDLQSDHDSGSDLEITGVELCAVQPKKPKNKPIAKVKKVKPTLSRKAMLNKKIALKRNVPMHHKVSQKYGFLPSKKVLHSMKQDINTAKLLRISGTASTLASDMNIKRFSDIIRCSSLEPGMSSAEVHMANKLQFNFKYKEFNSLNFSTLVESSEPLQFVASDDPVAGLRTERIAFNPCQQLQSFLSLEPENGATSGKYKRTLLCNSCKWECWSNPDFTKHWQHHLFLCKKCPYNSTTLLELEVHKAVNKHHHGVRETEGYILHKSGMSALLQPSATSKDSEALLKWLPVNEICKMLIVSDALLYQTATSTDMVSHFHMNKGVIIALLYYRFVPDKAIRNHIIEFHCNFCHFTSQSKIEAIRHMDFHLMSCDAETCSFKSYTRLELLIHKAKKHPECSKYCEELYISSLETKTVENITEHEVVNWQVTLDLPSSV